MHKALVLLGLSGLLSFAGVVSFYGYPALAWEWGFAFLTISFLLLDLFVIIMLLQWDAWQHADSRVEVKDGKNSK